MCGAAAPHHRTAREKDEALVTGIVMLQMKPAPRGVGY
jgi:hypothetical protein